MKTEILIVDSPDQEEVVAEVWCDDELWAVLSREHGTLLLSLYPRHTGKAWRLPFDDAVGLLHKARQLLLGEQSGDQ